MQLWWIYSELEFIILFKQIPVKCHNNVYKFKKKSCLVAAILYSYFYFFITIFCSFLIALNESCELVRVDNLYINV